ELMAPVKERLASQRPPEKPGADPAKARAEDQAFRQQLQRTAIPAGGAAAPAPPGGAPGPGRDFPPGPPPGGTIAGPDAPPPPKRSLLYQAALLGFAEVDFIDKKRGLEYHRAYRLIAAPPGTDPAVAWATATPVPGQIADGPGANAQWAEVPEA